MTAAVMPEKGHIKKAERLEIALLLEKNYSHRDIGRVLGKSHTSIGREVKKNSTRGIYDPHKAHVKARARRLNSKYQGMKIHKCDELKSYVIKKLKLHWTPEDISGRLKKIDTHLPYASHLAIYKYLYSALGQRWCKHLYSRRHKPKKKRGKKSKRTLIPNRTGIEQRCAEANNRTSTGHFEGDTVVSGKRHKSKTALTVLIERFSRYLRLRKIMNLKPKTNNKAIVKMTGGMMMKTMTLDNGVENTKHEELSKQLQIDIYFCDPYSSWQKPSVENVNKLIRRFVPKGSNIANYSHQYIARVEHIINNKPRKCLGYKTPLEVATESGILT